MVFILPLLLLTAAAWPMGEKFLLLRSGAVFIVSEGAEHKLFEADTAACSPDRRQIAFTSSRSLSIYSVATRTRRTLLTEAAQPAWSPKGDWIAFESGHGAVEIIHPDGTGRRRLLSQSFVFGLAWDPDGGTILFHDNRTLRRVDTGGKVISATALAAITGAENAVSSSDCFLPSPVNPDHWLYTRAVPGTPLFDSIFHEPNSALFLYDSKAKTRKRLSPRDMFVRNAVWLDDAKLRLFHRVPRQPAPVCERIQ